MLDSYFEDSGLVHFRSLLWPTRDSETFLNAYYYYANDYYYYYDYDYNYYDDEADYTYDYFESAPHQEKAGVQIYETRFTRHDVQSDMSIPGSYISSIHK